MKLYALTLGSHFSEITASLDQVRALVSFSGHRRLECACVCVAVLCILCAVIKEEGGEEENVMACPSVLRSHRGKLSLLVLVSLAFTLTLLVRSWVNSEGSVSIIVPVHSVSDGE